MKKFLNADLLTTVTDSKTFATEKGNAVKWNFSKQYIIMLLEFLVIKK